MPVSELSYVIYLCPDCGSIAVEPDDWCCTTGPDHAVEHVPLGPVRVVPEAEVEQLREALRSIEAMGGPFVTGQDAYTMATIARAALR